jgi:hypothetical protein
LLCWTTDVEASLTIDGQTINSGARAARAFVWTGNPASTITLNATIGQTKLPPITYEGTWALFQLVGDANRSTPIPAGHRVEWNLTQSLGRGGRRGGVLESQTAIRFDLEGRGADILQKSSLGNCV